jgi:hypothetical protein
MNQLKRWLPGVLLALVLLALPATVHAEPATLTADRWMTSVADFFSHLLDGLWSVEAAAEKGDEGPVAVPIDDGDSELTSGWDPNGAKLTTSPQLTSGWDPNG